MPRLAHSFTFALALNLAIAGTVQAQTLRGAGDKGTATYTFNQPRINRARVDWCHGYDFGMGPGTDYPAAFKGCGEEAANAFCQMSGYEKAESYEKDAGITDVTIYLQQMKLNPNPTRDAFKVIVCSRSDNNPPPAVLPPAVSETWRYPRVSGIRMDWCSAYDGRVGGPPNNPDAYLACGQPAADSFCRSVGYQSAGRFEKDEQIEDETIFIAQSALNTHSPKRDAFLYITCVK